MTGASSVVAVVLAAGRSRRFGSDKLLHPLGGKALAAHIADTLVDVPVRHRIAICPAGVTARGDLFSSRGFEVVENADPQGGMASSLALGAKRAMELEAGAMLVCLADMPNVSAEHVLKLIVAIETNESVATEAGGVRSPPAIFAARLLPELTWLSGDQGARHLLRNAAAVEALPDLVKDVDTPSDLNRGY